MPLSKLDQNYREMLNAAANIGPYNKVSERRESQRGRTSASSNRKKGTPNQGRGYSAHQREDSFSRGGTRDLVQGSSRKKGNSNQKKQLENSIKSVGKYVGEVAKQPPRKAKSQERFASNQQQYQITDKSNPNNNGNRQASHKNLRPSSSKP